MSSRVAVIGGGAWGCALAIQAARAGATVMLWARTRPRLVLPPTVRVVADKPRAADLILLAPPTQALRDVLLATPTTGPIVVCAKGIETTTGLLPHEIVASLRPGEKVAVLTGPNFAGEIAAGLPAAAVIAAADEALREQVATALGTASFRLYGNEDVLGAAIGGAAKNVIAIAAGAVIGAGLGENARAALVTRGLAELSRLVVALGGRAETVMGLSGLGDLLLTCTGPGSRNFSAGVALGRGDGLDAILATRDSVTEGVATAPALLTRARGVDLPICAAVADLFAKRAALSDLIARVLARPRRQE
jgi:glycerol-3-phosphate dehydrogenase (NAD(P)+)